jgi:hypothetical protein
LTRRSASRVDPALFFRPAIDRRAALNNLDYRFNLLTFTSRSCEPEANPAARSETWLNNGFLSFPKFL